MAWMEPPLINLLLSDNLERESSFVVGQSHSHVGEAHTLLYSSKFALSRVGCDVFSPLIHMQNVVTDRKRAQAQKWPSTSSPPSHSIVMIIFFVFGARVRFALAPREVGDRDRGEPTSSLSLSGSGGGWLGGRRGWQTGPRWNLPPVQQPLCYVQNGRNS